MAWSTGVLLVSVFVGLVIAAAIYAVTHGSSRSPFTDVPSPPPTRFVAASVVGHSKLPRGASLSAYVNADHVAVYNRPDGRLHYHEFHALIVAGKPVPLVLLVEHHKPGWLEVQLPERPNLGTGWVHAGDVTLHSDLYHVEAELTQHTLLVWEGTRVISRYPIGVGASVSPTPAGRYFIEDLLRPPSPDGLYGPYAFGLSAFSDVYTSFGGGPGEIGLHGTDDPTGLGHDVSHGCIRVSNATITHLSQLLPLGTPVVITRTPARPHSPGQVSPTAPPIPGYTGPPDVIQPIIPVPAAPRSSHAAPATHGTTPATPPSSSHAASHASGHTGPPYVIQPIT